MCTNMSADANVCVCVRARSYACAYTKLEHAHAHTHPTIVNHVAQHVLAQMGQYLQAEVGAARVRRQALGQCGREHAAVHGADAFACARGGCNAFSFTVHVHWQCAFPNIME